MQNKQGIKFLALGILLVISFFMSLLFGGSEKINWEAINHNDFIFWEIRFPKTITALVAGATLSLAGLVLQIIFRNPLAGPYVLGISSGASLMVAFSILAGSAFQSMAPVFHGKSFLVSAAIAGSFLVTLLILVVSKRVNSNVVLLLIGLMFSQICGAIQTALEYFADPTSLKSFVVWGMGSLSNTTNTDLTGYVPISVLAILALFLFVKPLNALLLGQNYSQNSGINFGKNRFWLILISSVLTGITTAFCGPVAFVGIAVPILSRMLFDTSRQQVHLFSCVLIGGSLLLLADALCHSLISNVALPINMLTTFIGAPLVIYLMFKNKHW
ncbi:MAG: iron ABC transporter permease [Bacteroidia bacterium]|nr:iron ABC transporter permease [Bacteroidia bacterium]